ncbi:MAG: hypothetical protein KDD09_24125, partial [Phaeodactylibacter sp.]|nr:hypothetical protein [Phaeodactylibacter sp.]
IKKMINFITKNNSPTSSKTISLLDTAILLLLCLTVIQPKHGIKVREEWRAGRDSFWVLHTLGKSEVGSGEWGLLR